MDNEYRIDEYRDDDDGRYESYADDLLKEWRQCLEKKEELENLIQCGFITNEE